MKEERGQPSQRIRLGRILLFWTAGAALFVAVFFSLAGFETIDATIILRYQVLFALSGFVTIWVAARLQGIDLRTVVGPIPNRRILAEAAVLGAICAMAGSGTSWLERMALAAVAPEYFMEMFSDPEMQDIVAESITWQNLPVALLGLVIATPLFEELAFRGLLLNWMLERWRFLISVVGSSICFAAIHDYPISGPLLMGILACLLYLRTGSLIATMLIHATYNLLFIVAISVMPFSADDLRLWAAIHQNAWVGAPALVIGAPIAYWYIKTNWPLARARFEASRLERSAAG